MNNLIERIGKTTVTIITGALTGLLLILSLISSCYLDKKEHGFYVFQSVIPVLVVLCLFLAITFLYNWYKSELKVKVKFKFNIYVLLIAAFIIGCVFVCFTHIKPAADQRLCLNIAKDIHHGVLDEFKPDGYMQTYPQQAGLVLFYYLIGFILGPKNYIGLQIINVIFYVFFIYCLYKTAYQLWKNETIANGTAVCTVLFIPLLFFTTFIYGTLIGLATSTFAIWKALEYMDTKKLRPAVLSVLGAVIAVTFKKNFIIVVAGIVILLLFYAFCKKHVKALILAAAFIACVFTMGKTVHYTMKAITGYELGKGMPAVSWVTMGLQIGSRPNGWYNAYTFGIYMDNDCDTEATAKVARKDLENRLVEFSHNIPYAVKFFAQKNASQWCEPTFEAFFITKYNLMHTPNETPRQALVKQFFNRCLVPYMDIFQSLIYIGVILYLLYNRKRITLWELLPLVIVIGGFIFHSFWEAKGQYVICYFVLLFPYCVNGYTYLCRLVHDLVSTYKENGTKFDRFQIPHLYNVAKPVIIVILVGLIFSTTKLVSSSVNQAVQASNGRYEASVTAALNPQPQKESKYSGQYQLKAWDSNSFLTLKSDKSTGTCNLYLINNTKQTEPFSIKQNDRGTQIIFKKKKTSLSKIDLPVVNEDSFKRRTSFYSGSKKWAITEEKDGSCYILNPNGFALSRTDDGKIVYEPFNKKSVLQKWMLSKIEHNQHKIN